jgi:Spy/CpxP family protein refolding chaperone
MRRLGRIALVLAVVVMVSSSALAQERQQRQRGQQGQRGQRGGFGGFGGGTVFLLNQKSVQDELKLSDEQITKAKELSDKQRESFRGQRGQRGQRDEEARKKLEEARQATEKAVAEILKPEQLKRVKQISLQQQGARALNNPDVATALKLSDVQKEKLKSIRGEAQTARGQRGQGGQRGQRSEEERKKQEEARKATNEKLMNVLTAEQKTKWKEMTGEPFKGEISRPQFRRPQASQQ